MGVCYHMWRFPVGYQSGQLGRTVNPLALPSYVRIVDPPPFFARGFGHGLFVFPTLFLHENTKGRKGLGTRGGVTAAPENRERRTENRARDKRATDGAVGTMLTAPFPRRHKRPNRRCRRFRRYRSAPAGRWRRRWPLIRLLARRRRRGVGQRPTPLQSTNPFVSFVSLVIEKHSGSPACGSTSPVSVPLCLLCELCVLRNLRFLLPPQRTVRLGGKRVRRTGVVKEKRTRNWVASLGTVMV